MPLTSESAKDIARIGANLEITPNAGFTSETVKDIVRIATGHGNSVSVHAGKYTSETLKDIARIGKNLVTIVV